jgi:hypothetical protein
MIGILAKHSIPSTSRTKGDANRSYRLQEPVNQTGPGEGTAYVADDPRVFHILVESSNLDWSFTVEEAVFGTQAGTARAPQ